LKTQNYSPFDSAIVRRLFKDVISVAVLNSMWELLR